jgi:hypothetical protein
MIWGVLLVIVLSGIIILLFRCMDFPEDNFVEMELPIEEICREEEPQFTPNILQVVGQDEDETYIRSGLEIRIYNEQGDEPVASEEIPGGKSIIRIGRSPDEDNDVIINHRMVSKRQYELYFEGDEIYLKAVKERNPIRIANSNWQEIRSLQVDETYCISNEKYNRFLINRMGVKMEIINFFAI